VKSRGCFTSTDIKDDPVFKLSHRQQRTIARSVCVSGVTFLTGADVLVRFRPADPDAGLHFVRNDLPGRPVIAATAENVVDTKRRTTLGVAGKTVTLVEHCLAALAGLRIDNCRIEIDGGELPGLDGSAAGYVEALLSVGVEPQNARKSVWSVDRPVTVRAGAATLSIHPAEEDDLRISYLLNYGPGSPIDRQTHTQTVTPGDFANDIACCRTFLLQSEALAMQANGIGSHATAKDLLVFGPRGLIDNRLRFANEPARHKVLDLVGDLALCGLDVRGHVVAYRSGHPLNVEMSRILVQQHAQVAARPARNLFRVAA
jgi:UDP-3-O-acyl N-acetylglucosamine deacetylase